MEGMVEELMANLEDAMKAKQVAEEAGAGGAEVASLTEQLHLQLMACSQATMEKTRSQNENQEMMQIMQSMEADQKAEIEVHTTAAAKTLVSLDHPAQRNRRLARF